MTTIDQPLTAHEAAEALDGSEYRKEGSRELFARMKAAGLVAVFGASDDLMEFRGAVYDEIGAYDGTAAYLTPNGLLKNKCREDICPYHAKERKAATKIRAVRDNVRFWWRYETTIPHSTFVIMEDGEPYCQGIVFALADVPPIERHP